MNADIENWNEIRTAYHVARLGTVSAAAERLGVHHATVIRHVEALEARLGAHLFFRHARGYTPTPAGQLLLRVAAATEDQFQQMAARVKGESNSMSGEIAITTIDILGRLITPWLTEFQQCHPGLRYRMIVDERKLRLDYGEAHIAIRAGRKPQEPDNIVQKFFSARVGLYAHKDYVARAGLIEHPRDMAKHRFLLPMNLPKGAPGFEWMAQNIPDEAIVFRASRTQAIEDALVAGMGIAAYSEISVRDNPDIVPVMPGGPHWRADFWLVTHVDLHRTAKVQACLDFLKHRAKTLATAV